MKRLVTEDLAGVPQLTYQKNHYPSVFADVMVDGLHMFSFRHKIVEV